MCCSNQNGPKWKREFVQDHKFDYIDIKEFHDRSCCARMGYLFLFVVVIKSFLVYAADLWSGVSLIVVGNSGANADAAIPPDVSKWIFLAAILISYLLLFWDIRKARGIIASRDISYAFTSVIVNRYYCLKKYEYYCLFRKINRSRKTQDDIAFFVFFTLKGWKRLLLADAPRQVINVVTLKALIPRWINFNNGVEVDNTALGKSTLQQIMTGTMAFSFAMFAVSFAVVCVAAVMYVPLVCHIQGNLKEYCCHKVDKRIEELLRKQAKKRQAKAQQKTYKKGKDCKDIEMEEFRQPTLPTFDMGSIHQSPVYQHQQPYYQDSMMSHFNRRNSISSEISDQAGLTAHAQAPAWSSPIPHHYGSPAPAYAYTSTPTMRSSPIPQHAGYYSPAQGHAVSGNPYQNYHPGDYGEY